MKNVTLVPVAIVQAPVFQNSGRIVQPIRTPMDELSQRVLNNFRKTAKHRIRTTF